MAVRSENHVHPVEKMPAGLSLVFLRRVHRMPPFSHTFPLIGANCCLDANSRACVSEVAAIFNVTLLLLDSQKSENSFIFELVGHIIAKQHHTSRCG